MVVCRGWRVRILRDLRQGQFWSPGIVYEGAVK